MERNIDDLLKKSLTPTEEPGFWLNQKLIDSGCEKGKISMKKSKKKTRRLSYAIGASLFLGLSVTGIYAAVKHFTPQQVANQIEDEALEKAFEGKDAICINKTQEFKNYKVTLLGMVSGKNLTDFSPKSADSILPERTYCVVSFENADGTPMKDNYEEKINFIVSPFVKGYDPTQVNLKSLDGGHTEFIHDGVVYRLVECDNVEKFASSEVYLGILDGYSYETDAYHYNQKSGAITRNKNYKGVNALFTLPVDKKKADKGWVEEFVKILDKNEGAKNEEYYGEEQYILDDNNEVAEQFRIEGKAGERELVGKLTPENLTSFTKKLEGYDQVLEPKDGKLFYKVEVDGTFYSVEGENTMDMLFPEGKAGRSNKFGSISTGGDYQSLIIESYTLREDGKVLLELYKFKK